MNQRHLQNISHVSVVRHRASIRHRAYEDDYAPNPSTCGIVINIMTSVNT